MEIKKVLIGTSMAVAALAAVTITFMVYKQRQQNVTAALNNFHEKISKKTAYNYCKKLEIKEALPKETEKLIEKQIKDEAKNDVSELATTISKNNQKEPEIKEALPKETEKLIETQIRDEAKNDVSELTTTISKNNQKENCITCVVCQKENNNLKRLPCSHLICAKCKKSKIRSSRDKTSSGKKKWSPKKRRCPLCHTATDGTEWPEQLKN